MGLRGIMLSTGGVMILIKETQTRIIACIQDMTIIPAIITTSGGIIRGIITIFGDETSLINGITKICEDRVIEGATAIESSNLEKLFFID